MTGLTPEMRLKVKRDTFFLSEPNKGVYFRNNASSFNMEGSSIDQWVEKLLPMFNGEFTLAELTNGLPDAYRNRVYDIANVLYKNGYLRDVSQDQPHQLKEQALKKYAPQIEFLNSFGNSGAYRFQTYRQSNVLAIGSGPIFVSLVSALLESGLSKLQVLITDTVPTNRKRIAELEKRARLTDPEVEIREMTRKNHSSWREILQPFDSILFVANLRDLEELRALHTACREEKKIFMPAIMLDKVGLAGPLVLPESEGCWESAWRRIHQPALSEDKEIPSHSATSEAMLANIIVFELFKYITRSEDFELTNQFYLLDLGTLEGNWHSFLPHPLVTDSISVNWLNDIDLRMNQDLNQEQQRELLLYFNQLTSEDSGIFHVWAEEDLNQLPLSQCYIQVADPLSDGPSNLQPKIIRSGLTHEEARREAGLTGIEAYMTRFVDFHFSRQLDNHQVESLIVWKKTVGVGTGETWAEAVCRGLQKHLELKFKNQALHQKWTVAPIQLNDIKDSRCQFYLKALTTMQGAPIIGLGEELDGFPVVWLRTNGQWYGSVEMNVTLAFRNVLQQAIMEAQNETTHRPNHGWEVSCLEERAHFSLEIPAIEEKSHIEILRTAIEDLNRNHKQLLVFELEGEPFIKAALAGVYGVLIREEEAL